MYHRHTIVYHKNGFWSTVSSNKPRAEISKLCDVHLLLLGDLKYREIRPITTSSNGKDKVNWDEFELWFTKACRNNQPPPPIPQSTRKKRASTTPINYYDLNCGRNASKTSKQRNTVHQNQNEVSILSEPSPTRLAAQERIRLEKLKCTTSEIMIVGELPADLDGQPFIRPTPARPTIKDEIKKEIKQEIKMEDETRNTRHLYKNQELDWHSIRYVHKDGLICNKEKLIKEQRLREEESQLPDIPAPSDDLAKSTNFENADSLCAETNSAAVINMVETNSVETTMPPTSYGTTCMFKCGNQCSFANWEHTSALCGNIATRNDHRTHGMFTCRNRKRYKPSQFNC